MISLEKWMILAPLQKLPNNLGDLGKTIIATGFEWLPKVNKNHPIWSHWLWHSCFQYQKTQILIQPSAIFIWNVYLLLAVEKTKLKKKKPKMDHL